jgi:threonine/homoserine/homoserine lactone efflux protein
VKKRNFGERTAPVIVGACGDRASPMPRLFLSRTIEGGNGAAGIMVQGVSLGYIVASLLQGMVVQAILDAEPRAEEFLDWILM